MAEIKTTTIASCTGFAGSPSKAVSTVTEGETSKEPTVPASKTGSLTTRTSNSAGVVTGQAGHAIPNGGIVDVFWAGGVRFGCTAAVSGNLITLSGGGGDNLPVQGTAVTIANRALVDEEFLATGANIQGIFLSCTFPAVVHFIDDTGPGSVSLPVTGAGTDNVYTWQSGKDGANPLAGLNITRIFATQKDSAAPHKVQAAVLFP